MYSLHSTDAEHAARVLSHSLCPLLSPAVVTALEEIAAGGQPLSADRRRLLRDALIVIELAEVLISRRAA
jgi:hypothetical protein